MLSFLDTDMLDGLVPESEAESKMLFWWISAYTQSDTYVTCPCYAPSHDRG